MNALDMDAKSVTCLSFKGLRVNNCLVISNFRVPKSNFFAKFAARNLTGLNFQIIYA